MSWFLTKQGLGRVNKTLSNQALVKPSVLKIQTQLSLCHNPKHPNPYSLLPLLIYKHVKAFTYKEMILLNHFFILLT